jgi:hypothetical protein
MPKNPARTTTPPAEAGTWAFFQGGQIHPHVRLFVDLLALVEVGAAVAETGHGRGVGQAEKGLFVPEQFGCGFGRQFAQGLRVLAAHVVVDSDIQLEKIGHGLGSIQKIAASWTAKRSPRHHGVRLELARDGLVSKLARRSLPALSTAIEPGPEVGGLKGQGKGETADIAAGRQLESRSEKFSHDDTRGFRLFGDGIGDASHASLAHVVGLAQNAHHGRDGVQDQVFVQLGRIAGAEVVNGVVRGGDDEIKGTVFEAGAFQGEFFGDLGRGRGIRLVQDRDALSPWETMTDKA